MSRCPAKLPETVTWQPAAPTHGVSKRTSSMMYGISFVLKYLMGKDVAARNFAVFPDDTMIVSYPRSGNTWTRFLIANLLHPAEEVDFLNIEKFIPDTSSISNR